MAYHATSAASTAYFIQTTLPVASDIVHFDFNPANLLISNGANSGVVDWDGVFAGDCSFDLATLLFYAYDDASLREQLRQHILARTNPGILSVYLAHLILRQTGWSLRLHDAATSNHYLAMSYAILKDIACTCPACPIRLRAISPVPQPTSSTRLTSPRSSPTRIAKTASG